ncbi:hypothetical protein [Nocardioides szechwanensis]|uniref:hypothetical protein n=1 Tax=Nocardioides szechwanensis TaxID=1005944 RepID=UPI00115FFF73|nr:hypothetical protein [Nocardioides szechwanensis]
MNLSQWGADEWAAFGQVGALVVAVVAGPAVWIQVRQGRHAREDQARIREDQSRPYVIVDFESKGWWLDLVIKNIGSTPARDVRITFDKALVVPGNARQLGDLDIFKQPIPMIAPGRAIRLRFGAGPDFFKPEAAGVPLSYEATVAYTDLAGEKSYNDPPLLLDVKSLQNTIAGADHLSDLSSSIKEIQKTLKGWSGPGALEVLATDGDKRQRAQNRLDHRWDLRHSFQERGLRGVLRFEWSRLRRRLRD